MTPRQHAVLMFVDRYLKEHGWAPTLQQIADAFGFASKSGPLFILRRLEEQGYVRRLPNRDQAIEVLRLPSVPEAKPYIPWLEDETTKRHAITHTDMVESDGVHPGDVLILDKDDRLIGMIRKYPDSGS